MSQRNVLERSERPSWMKGVGPYIGKIVNHLDPEYNGRIEVEILKITKSGNSEEGSGYLIPCQYISPFYGVTPREGLSENAGYDYTQKSYGMWAIPPDVGVRVLVFCAEEQFGYGFWFGCIPDNKMNFMLPGYASTTYNDTDKSSPLPVGEYNKKTEKGVGTDATAFIKPANTDAVSALTTSGLKNDNIRGTNTSSARREVPSMVFGLSTPGIYDRRPGKPKAKYGEKVASANIPFSRLGGHSFVMDDGDATLLRKGHPSSSPPTYANFEAGESGDFTLPHNDLIRLKTRTGHQILMHNSEDLIYISNAKGSSWIELTSNGKIDIYATDSVSVHTSNDLNITADRDIIMKAGRNIVLNAGKDGLITAAEGTHISAKTHTESAPDGINMNGPQAKPAYSPMRTPEHEPWGGHENLAPTEHTSEKSDADPAAGNTPFVATGSPSVPDTFRKSK